MQYANEGTESQFVAKNINKSAFEIKKKAVRRVRCLIREESEVLIGVSYEASRTNVRGGERGIVAAKCARCCARARLLSGNFSCRMNKKFIQCVHFKGTINNTGTYPRYSMINYGLGTGESSVPRSITFLRCI